MTRKPRADAAERRDPISKTGGDSGYVTVLAVILLLMVLVAGWCAQVLGLPGNWLIVTAVVVYAWLMPSDSAVTLGWPVVLTLLGLATLGELLEFAMGALGVTRAGGSRRGAVLAILGSILGGVAGAVVGLPIPIVGSLAAALLFGGLGALGGAILGETWKGRDLDSSIEIGKAAFVGRLLGTLAKLIVGTLMVLVTVLGLIV